MFSVVARNIIPRTISSLRPLSAYRFNSGSAMHNGDPEVLEVEKRRNLEKQQHLTSTPHEGAPGWNEYLASSSEAFVKADKFGQEGPPSSDMAEKTIEHIKKRHADVKSSREEAKYERDEVEGPLRTSVTGEIEELQEEEDKVLRKDQRLKNMTRSEQDVKSDRGEFDKV